MSGEFSNDTPPPRPPLLQTPLRPIAQHASSYIEEWIDRFESGHPETLMDAQSLRVWNENRAALMTLREEAVA